MGNTFESPTALSLCIVACALVLASTCATAKADPRPVANIPAADHKSEVDPSSSLPLPYESWAAAGQLPPTPTIEPDAPPPLARARELPRRPFELAATLAALLPSCGSGSIDDRGCLTAHPSGGVDLALVYRVSPFFGVGLEGVVGGGAGSGGSATRFGGVVGRLYFAESGAWDPYLALTLGAGKLTLQGDGDAQGATSGLGGRVAGGLDYLFGSHVRLGPTASFAHWIAWSEQQCAGSVCRDQRLSYGRLLGFATLGLRLTTSFGDKL
jgi:hypothetical protein